MCEVKKIILNYGTDKELEVTKEEAEGIYKALKTLLGHVEYVPYPVYPTYPEPQPYYPYYYDSGTAPLPVEIFPPVIIC